MGDHRAAVAAVIRAQMKDLGLSVPEVMNRSGLSENTVRDMAYGSKPHNKSSWMVMSGALEFLPKYLLQILRGEVDANAPVKSPMERRLAQMTSELAGIGELRKDVGVLKDVVFAIDEKIEIIIRTQRRADGNGESD